MDLRDLGNGFKLTADAALAFQLANKAYMADKGSPIPIISAYRDPQRNSSVGGSPTSNHLRANALDIDPKAWNTVKPYLEAVGFKQLGGTYKNPKTGKTQSEDNHFDFVGQGKKRGNTLADNALQAAHRFSNKPKPVNQVAEFGKGLATGQPFTPTVNKPTAGGEFAFGAGNLVGAVGSTLGAGLLGGLPALVTGGGTFAKQAAIEGGSPGEVATRGLLGAAATAIPMALGGSMLTRAATGAAIGGGTVAADEAVRRGFRGEAIDGSIFTDPNTQFGAGFGGLVGALTGGRGKVPKMPRASEPKLLTDGKITDPARLLTGEVQPDLYSGGTVYGQGSTMPQISARQPKLLTTNEPKLLTSNEPKLLTDNLQVSTPETNMPVPIEGRGMQMVRETTHGGLQRPLPEGGIWDQSTQGVLLKGLGKTEQPNTKVNTRLSEAPVNTPLSEGTPGVVSQTFDNGVLAKRYAKKLQVEAGYDPSEVIITQSVGGKPTVTVQPKAVDPAIKPQMDALVQQHQANIQQIRSGIASSPDPLKAELLANKQIQQSYKDFELAKQKIMSQDIVETPLDSTKLPPEASPQGEVKNSPNTPLSTMGDLRPNVTRKGGMTLPGELNTYTSLPEMQKYAPGLFESAFSPTQQSAVDRIVQAIQAKKAVDFTYVPEHSRSSKLNTASVMPTHIDTRLGNKVRLFGVNSNGEQRAYTIARLENGKPVKGAGIGEVLGVSEPTDLHLQGADPNFQSQRIMAKERLDAQKNFTTLKQAFPDDKFIDRAFRTVFDKETQVPDALKVMNEYDALPKETRAKYRDALKKKGLC